MNMRAAPCRSTRLSETSISTFIYSFLSAWTQVLVEMLEVANIHTPGTRGDLVMRILDSIQIERS